MSVVNCPNWLAFYYNTILLMVNGTHVPINHFVYLLCCGDYGLTRIESPCFDVCDGVAVMDNGLVVVFENS